MKLHQIFICCKNAIYTSLPTWQATFYLVFNLVFKHALTWCFQHLCEDAIADLISQRRVLSLRDVTRRSHSWLVLDWDHRLGLSLPWRAVVFLPTHLPSMNTSSLSLGELALPSPKWHILPEASPPPTISYSQALILSFSMPLLPNLF